MSRLALIILIHQIVFQGMFLVKNILLRRKLGIPVRGRNKEANLSIGFFGLFIISAIVFGLNDTPPGTIDLMPITTARNLALLLLAVNLLAASASLIGLKDSWRVGVLEDQKTDLIQGGIYRFSRNPYFLSYLMMFAAYTVLLQNLILLLLSFMGFVMIHIMVLKEEKHLSALHGDGYNQYTERVPRYFIV